MLQLKSLLKSKIFVLSIIISFIMTLMSMNVYELLESNETNEEMAAASKSMGLDILKL
ncbi:MAG: hypothetical protein Q4B23_05970 [Helcococcus sp.]|nr:hypothetical protein [Helcococcus sp.]